MAFKSTLELYSDIILPRLAEGPKTLEQLDVPPYAVKHLEAHGLVSMKTFLVGAVGVQVWFLAEDLALLKEAGELGPTLKHCDELEDSDFPPES